MLLILCYVPYGADAMHHATAMFIYDDWLGEMLWCTIIVSQRDSRLLIKQRVLR
jgi:hypothetical protein